jgi:nucleoside-diphosphate-sugar epimerase
VRIFVAGGTGVLGRRLVEALVDRGHEVTASTHRTENFSVIEALGARPALMDGLDDAAVRQAILETEPEVIINQITALSAPSRDDARWLALTNRLRSEGTKTLMTAAREAGTRRVVAQSASFLTQPVGSDPTDESWGQVGRRADCRRGRRPVSVRSRPRRMSRVPLNFGGGPGDHQAASTTS